MCRWCFLLNATGSHSTSFRCTTYRKVRPLPRPDIRNLFTPKKQKKHKSQRTRRHVSPSLPKRCRTQKCKHETVETDTVEKGFVFQAAEPGWPPFIDDRYRDVVRAYQKIQYRPSQSSGFDAEKGEFVAGTNMVMEFCGMCTIHVDATNNKNETGGVDEGKAERLPQLRLSLGLLVNGEPCREGVATGELDRLVFPICMVWEKVRLCAGDRVSLAVSADSFLPLSSMRSLSASFGGAQL